LIGAWESNCQQLYSDGWWHQMCLR